jgi:hypothetical protein
MLFHPSWVEVVEVIVNGVTETEANGIRVKSIKLVALNGLATRLSRV